MQTHKAMATKLPMEEYLRVADYCKRANKTPSQLIRGLLLEEIAPFAPSSMAGRNVLEYSKKEDMFTWSVELDNGEKVAVLEKLSPEYLKDLLGCVSGALTMRDELQGKRRKSSVPVPKKLARGKR